MPPSMTSTGALLNASLLLVVGLHCQMSEWRVAAFAPSPMLPTRVVPTKSEWSGRSGIESRMYTTPPDGEAQDAAAVENENSSAVGNLLDSASRLRREAEALEAEMKVKRGTTGARESTAVDTSLRREASYDALPDSAWTISYRFTSEPPPKDDEQASGAGQAIKPMRYYSGKVGIKFRADGYTDITDAENVKDIQICKFWGWDEEESSEDGLRYILFSADVVLPESDRNAVAAGGPTRFYFQARVDEDRRTGALSLADGKVTVKRDVEPPGGFWGVFGGKGILAQFRDVGDFVCRASSEQ